MSDRRRAARIAPPERASVGAAPRAVDLPIDPVRRHPGGVTILAIGPQTNIALALLEEPRLRGEIGAVAFMGGGLWLDADFGRGNITPVAECDSGSLAGEIGHTSRDWHGPGCTCGSRGCLGLQTSILNVSRAVCEGLREGRPTVFPAEAPGAEAFRNGNPLAAGEVEAVGRAFGPGADQRHRPFRSRPHRARGRGHLVRELLLRLVRTGLRDMVLSGILDQTTITTCGLETDIATNGSLLGVLQRTRLGAPLHA